MNSEFLKLLQMVEAGRKCEGKACIEVVDAEVEIAKEIDALEDGHRADQTLESHLEWECVQCLALNKKIIELRESLHNRGIDFPEEILRPR